MSNVIGPISQRSWKTLRMLRYSIKQMKAANDNDLFEQINKESSLYNNLLSLYTVRRSSPGTIDKQVA